MIGAVGPELRSAELTGRWEGYLKKVERGEGSVERFMGSIEAFVTAVVGGIKERRVAVGPMVWGTGPEVRKAKGKKAAPKRRVVAGGKK